MTQDKPDANIEGEKQGQDEDQPSLVSQENGNGRRSPILHSLATLMGTRTIAVTQDKPKEDSKDYAQDQDEDQDQASASHTARRDGNRAFSTAGGESSHAAVRGPCQIGSS